MKPRVPFLFAVVVLVLAPVRAWVSRTEMMLKKGRISLPVMRAKAEDDDDTSSVEAYRERLERRFNAFGDHSHDFFSSSLPLYDEDEERIESGWPDESTMACGDDCEECEIPEELRMTDMDPIDVLAYLQIRRAEPLRVERNDWE